MSGFKTRNITVEAGEGGSRLKVKLRYSKNSDKGVFLTALCEKADLFSQFDFFTEYLEEKGIASVKAVLLSDEEADTEKEKTMTKKCVQKIEERLAAIFEKTKEIKEFESAGLFAACRASVAGFNNELLLKNNIKALVTASGTPELLKTEPTDIKVPLLLITGGNDYRTISANRELHDKLETENKLEIIPGADRYYSDPEMSREVIRMASEWFEKYL